MMFIEIVNGVLVVRDKIATTTKKAKEQKTEEEGDESPQRVQPLQQSASTISDRS